MYNDYKLKKEQRDQFVIAKPAIINGNTHKCENMIPLVSHQAEPVNTSLYHTIQTLRDYLVCEFPVLLVPALLFT